MLTMQGRVRQRDKQRERDTQCFFGSRSDVHVANREGETER